jgi:putative ABC transport system permease protein
MLLYWFTVARRSLMRNKLFSFINISGLAVGFAVCLLAVLFIRDELSYDRQGRDAGRTYRVVTDLVNGSGAVIPDATTPPALATALRTGLREIEGVTRLFPSSEKAFFVRAGRKELLESSLWHADSTFFSVFPFPFIEGNPRTALTDPHSIVLTQSVAEKYFGSPAAAMGKTMRVDDWEPATVTAVINDLPSNTHLAFTMLVPLSRFNPSDNWGWSAFYTYIRLRPNTSIKAVDEKIQALAHQAVPESPNRFSTQRVTSIHLDSNRKQELTPGGDRSYLYIFGGVAIFILLIAVINYINLSTAQSSLRAKEIGIRKVSGAGTQSLAGQFLVETLLTSLLAANLALLLTYFLLPVFNQISVKRLHPWQDAPVVLCLSMYGFAVLTGILAGIYPARYLSAFRPALILKGSARTGSVDLNLRKVLVVLQFSLSIGLIIGTMVVWQQITFLRNARLGLNKDNVLIVDAPFFISSTQALKAEWQRIPGVETVSVTNGSIPGLTWDMPVRYGTGGPGQRLQSILVDKDYLNCMGMSLQAGTNWLSDSSSNSVGEVMLNETAVRQLGIEEPVIGKMLESPPEEKNKKTYRITGVVRDFHYTSLKNEILPFAFQKLVVNASRRKIQSDVAIKIDGRNVPQTIAAIEKIWKENVSEWPFQFRFLDDSFARLYSSEMTFTRIFTYTSLLAILIACLGLFGLSIFAMNQRTKEIGIRKVLGSSVRGITILLTIDFVRLILIAAAVAIPVAAWTMHTWLQQFAYRTGMHWWIFALGMLIALVIALTTIGYQAVRAALVNPVKSLRAE